MANDDVLHGSQLLHIFVIVLYKNTDLMWKQSVWTSTISSHLATKHLKEGGLLTLAGAKAALAGTPGNST